MEQVRNNLYSLRDFFELLYCKLNIVLYLILKKLKKFPMFILWQIYLFEAIQLELV